MKLLKRHGQSTGEYAILFAIVLGAVFAMQNFIRNRIAGGLGSAADQYIANVNTATGGKGLKQTITRDSDSTSGTSADMTDSRTGQLKADSDSKQVVTNPE